VYVVEDLRHVVNIVEETMPREVTNLLPSKSSIFSEQLQAETVCSSIVYTLTPSNVEVRPTTANVTDTAT
jgi:rRNA pseudouridine-1189 N-methylase Emg1 (Nep1/Mra1 family)